MKRTRAAFFFFALAFYGCRSDKGENCVFIPDTKDIPLEFTMESLEDSLPSVTTKSELVSFFTRHPALRDHFFGRSAYPSDSAFINKLYLRFINPSMDTLLMDAHQIFGNGSELKEQFRQAFSNIKYYYPGFKPPRVQTVISGMETDLLVTDTLIIVGLDYFLGPAAHYRPNMYEYMLRRYHKDFLVPSVLLLYGIDNSFNKTDLTDKTVLADMVAYGKAFYFAKRMMPCLPDSVLIGFTSEEISSARENENLIYARLIENEVIYSTSHQVKQRYLAERPKTLEIGERCPGRIGQWIGWQIIETYAARNTSKSVPDIMSVSKAPILFKDSRYRPDRK